MSLGVTLLLSAVLAAGMGSAGLPPSPAADPTNGLSVRELAGQMIVHGYEGTRPPPELIRRVRRGEAGGVIVFSRNIGSRASLRRGMRALQRAAATSPVREPLLVMIDQEGGLVKRLSGAPTLSPAQIGRTGSTSVAREQGRATARNLRGAGVNVNLAPVMDVGRQGSYQQRSGRSYGGSARAVSRLGSAFVGGLQDGGVAATLKHFPGLGTVSGNEDLVIQEVTLPRSTLRKVDEAPFGAGIEAGAGLVMTSTAVYRALDGAPAMLSRRAVDGELRGRLGFSGVVLTDDLEVPAMDRLGGLGDLGLRAVRAGNDMLLYAQSMEAGVSGHEAVVRSVRRGGVSVERLRESARRVIALRRALRRP